MQTPYRIPLLILVLAALSVPAAFSPRGLAWGLAAHTSQLAIRLKPNNPTNGIFTVQTRVEMRGSLVIPGEQSPSVLPITATADLQYSERFIGQPAPKSIRSYTAGQVQAKIGDRTSIHRLDPLPRLVLAQRSTDNQSAERIRFVGLDRTLTQREWELLRTPADTLILNAWVATDRELNTGDRWAPSDDFLADALNVDRINSHSVEFQITTVRDGRAAIHLAGEVRATVDGAESEITVRGELVYDTRDGIVAETQLTLSENRAPSQIAPGYEAVIKLESNVRPAHDIAALSDDALRGRKINPRQVSHPVLALANPGQQWHLEHARHWRLIQEAGSRTILRLVADGQVIAQCDIIPLPRWEANKAPDLKSFQQGVLQALEKMSGQVVGAETLTGGNRNSILRVTAKGSESDVELHFIYYLVQQADGRRVQLAFVTEPDRLEQLGDQDLHLAQALQFFDPPATETTTPADPPTRRASATHQKKVD